MSNMSGFELHVEPNTPPQQPEQFIVEKGPFSIALDGYVHGAPWFDESGPRANFNHHEDVDRLATAATCEQVLTAIRSGLFQTFRKDGLPKAEVYVNDCDQDVCTAYYLLTHAPMVESATNPLINALVSVEGKLDATAGAYPFSPDLAIMRKIAWMFQPYTEFRKSGDINRRETPQFEQVIESCSRRIDDYMLGKGKELPLDIRYEVLDQRPGYTVVREIGDNARIGMYASGINAFLSVQEIDSAKDQPYWRYTVGRRSLFIPFPTDKIFETLNGVDTAVEGQNNWGGGNLIGGSPRATGSNLNPEQVTELIDGVLTASDIK